MVKKKHTPFFWISVKETELYKKRKKRETKIYTHILLHLQDWDEDKFLVLVLVEELWI